ncbi:hypothetical protein TNCT_307931 [Trichonephila clavata]|uniref:Uncharacterized protein n=1 Tax=Trichonephila clavata TaxID=2740835 RepID=A0A8X6GA75_TRICU|nr:hypothetical protein TNCT_307931 [Trichonephila clavata]
MYADNIHDIILQNKCFQDYKEWNPFDFLIIKEKKSVKRVPRSDDCSIKQSWFRQTARERSIGFTEPPLSCSSNTLKSLSPIIYNSC